MVSDMIIGFLNGRIQHNNTQRYKTGIDEAELLFLTDSDETRAMQGSVPRDRIKASWESRKQLICIRWGKVS